jgi:hypothetical protein
MTVLSFLNDLGIIPNEGTGLENDENLLQGQQLMEYGRGYTAAVNNKFTHLQETSLPKVGTVIEALYSPESLNNNVTTVNMTELTNDEKEFHKTMNEYSTTYNMLSHELLESSKKDNNTETNKNNKNKKNLLKELDNKNNKLISLSAKIGNDVNSIETSDDYTKNQINEKQKELRNSIDRINNQTRDMNKRYDEETLNGQKETSGLNLISKNYFYWFWMIVLVIIVIIATNIMTSRSDEIGMVNIVFVGMLVAVYFLLK